jgi:predicted enzyme related to lactoylglutathione lyase
MMHPRDFTRRATVGLALGAAATVQAKAMGFTPKGETTMERVVGIGGFFFRANDPKALARWYEDNLGILPVPSKYNMPSWETEAGTTVFAPFPKNTDYFGDPNQQWMLNFRVRDLDKMAAQLRANGIAVEVDPELYPNGRFAQLKDIEGNPIQLWQPGGKDPG